jgi:CO dehydrogenase nickel-insertion accessory protein CooC1
LLGQLESDDRIVIADMEAGAGTLTRMQAGSLDVAVLVVEPSTKSIDVARRASEIIRERHIGMLLAAANRVRDDADLKLVRESLPGLEIAAVPDDARITQADREGRSPLDTAADAPAVRAVAALARRLVRLSPPPSSVNLPIVAH